MEFNQDGELLFKGEYFNDKMWNGKSDNKNNNISYEFKNGKDLLKDLQNIMEKQQQFSKLNI